VSFELHRSVSDKLYLSTSSKTTQNDTSNRMDGRYKRRTRSEMSELRRVNTARKATTLPEQLRRQVVGKEVRAPTQDVEYRTIRPETGRTVPHMQNNSLPNHTHLFHSDERLIKTYFSNSTSLGPNNHS
jgi:hypothetical protein